MKKIKLTDIVTTSGTQTRVEIHEDTVAEYAERMKAGDTFPAVVVFYDGTAYYLADGFHRVLAASRASMKMIDADVRKGSRRDALLYSIGANSSSENKKTADYETRLTEAQREVEAAADNLERAADQLEGALRIGADDGAMETLNHRLQAARRRNMAAQPPPCGPGAERRG